MSVKTMGKVWDLKLPHNQAWVLMAMADHADHSGGSIFPGLPLIAWKTGYSVPQVRRIVKELTEDGILVEEAAPPGKPKQYHIDFSKAERKPEYKPKATNPAQNDSGNNPSQNDTPIIVSEGTTPSTPIMPSLKIEHEPSVFKPSVPDAREEPKPEPTVTEQDLLDGFNNALKAKATGAIVLEALTVQNRTIARTLILQGHTRESIQRYTEHRLFGRREKYQFKYIPEDLLKYPMPEVYVPESRDVQPPPGWGQPKPKRTPEEIESYYKAQEEVTPNLARQRKRREMLAKRQDGAA